MTVMGEAPPEAWTDELRRTGRVVFPLRRQPLVWRTSTLIIPMVFVATAAPGALEYGIRFGRRKFMPWSEIGALGSPGSPTFDQTFTVIPNTRRRKLTLRQQNVRDLPAFRHWLEELLAQHRATNREPEITW
jgi:hypothetical protein